MPRRRRSTRRGSAGSRSEPPLIKRILAVHGASQAHRLWRNPTGHYYAGQVVETNHGREARMTMLMPGQIILSHPRHITAGLCEGSADLIGLSNGGLFTGIEVKTENVNVEPHQRRWLEVVRELGGITGVARDEADVQRILRREL